MEVIMFFSSLLLTATPAATGTGGTDWTSNALMIGLLVVVFGFMYFFTIRPQRKRDKDLKAQVAKMAVGDTVVTIGGLVGTIANIQDDNITVTTSVAHTMVTYKKSAISTILPRQQ
jgi:preprotein translocase subunit YajC